MVTDSGVLGLILSGQPAFISSEDLGSPPHPQTSRPAPETVVIVVGKWSLQECTEHEEALIK